MTTRQRRTPREMLDWLMLLLSFAVIESGKRTVVVDEDLAALILNGIGTRLPGGCDECEAYQRLEYQPRLNLWSLTCCHDDDCPFFVWWQEDVKRMRAERYGRKRTGR